MRKLFFTLSILFIGLSNVFSQKNPNMVYSTEKTPLTITLPVERKIYGGTIINVTYKGSQISKTIKGAFEYACKLVEENIPTTFPLNINMEFTSFTDANCLAQVETYSVSSDVAPQYRETDKVYAKRCSQTYSFPHFTDKNEEISFFRDTPDATIKFSKRAKFDYNLDQNKINPNKYDFITVATQALLKAIGFNIKAYASGNLLKVAKPENQFTAKLIGSYAMSTEEDNYKYATSGKANIYSEDGERTWYLNSDTPYKQGISLNYFVDSDDKETAIMQYGISKGTSIRYIGKAIQDFFSFCGWDRPIATGMSGTYVKETTTSNVQQFQQPQKVNSTNESYISPISYYNNSNSYNIGSKQEWGDAGKYVLLKDGSWQPFKNLTDLTNNSLYARTIDGYLRLKNISVSYGPGGNYKNHHITYELYDYIPQKPNAEFNNVEYPADTNTRVSNEEDNFVEAEIGIKDLEGTTQILVEQTDSDYPVPYSYMVDNISEGKFTAFMNKLYPSTFKLTYINKNGKTEGEPFTIDLRAKVEPQIKINISKDGIIYNVKHNDSQKKLYYQITNITNGNIISKGFLPDNKGIISTKGIREGLHIVTVFCGKSEISELKWNNIKQQ